MKSTRTTERSRAALWPAALLFAIVLVAYAPTFSNGFVWDDDDHITGNVTLRTLDGLRRIWLEPGATVQYYPATFTAFWACHLLWGDHPLGYHLVNALMHALASVLFFRLLRRLQVRGALFAAAIFAVHPVHVMSVAWATELKNTLSTSLGLGACLFYLGFAGIGPPMAALTRRTLYALALGLFAAAVLAKTAAGMLPLTLALVVWWKKDRPRWGDFWPIAPLGALAIAAGQMTAHVERLTGAVGAQFDLDTMQRVVVAGRSFWFYLGKLLMPANLTFIYPRWNLETVSWPDLLPASGALVALAALLAGRRRVGKGPFVGAMHFFFGTSALILFLVLYMTRYSFVSDHWQYLGSLGMIALFAATATAIPERFGVADPRMPRALAGAAISLLAVLTWRQCGVYRDAETLWRATLERNPDAWIAHVNLGTILVGKGRADEGLGHYLIALVEDPFRHDPAVRAGVERFGAGDAEAGLEAVRRALALRPFGYEACSGIGVVLARMSRVDEALDFFDAAVRANPSYATGHLNRGHALAALGRNREAAEAFSEAIRRAPDRTEAYVPLAQALHAEGRDEEGRRVLAELTRRGVAPPPGIARALSSSEPSPPRDGR